MNRRQARKEAWWLAARWIRSNLEEGCLENHLETPPEQNRKDAERIREAMAEVLLTMEGKGV